MATRRSAGLSQRVRDAVLLALGSVMLLWMFVTGHVNVWLVTAALACLGVPTGLGARALSRDRGTRSSGREESSSPVEPS